MAHSTPSALPRLTPEQRRAAAGQFERANQVLAAGDFDYGIQLLLTCCQIDPGNAVYRQALRQAQKSKHHNNLRGQSLAFLTSLRAKAKVRSALKAEQYLKVLEFGEQVLVRNPWDVGTNLAMAEAFDELGLTSLAIWTLDQLRQAHPNNPKVNRPLARLFEKAGNFTAAMALWEMVRKADPTDSEAAKKHKDLAASATIAKGRYEDALHGQAPSPIVGNNNNAPAHAGSSSELSETAAEQAAVSDTQTHRPAPAPSESAAPRSPREVQAILARIQANPTNPNGYLHLAAFYRRLEQYEQARRVLQEGLGPTGNHFEIMMELVDLDIEPFRRDLAMAEAKLQEEPDNQELQAIRTRLAKEVALRELDWYRRKADRFPTEASYRFEVGVRLLQTGQTDEAIRVLQGVRSDPRHQGKALVYLGFCFQKRNNWRLAQRNFEEALTHLGPAEEGLRKEILYQLARGHAAAGDLNRAVDLGCELANLDYSFKDIGPLLDDWNARLQKA